MSKTAPAKICRLSAMRRLAATRHWITTWLVSSHTPSEKLAERVLVQHSKRLRDAFHACGPTRSLLDVCACGCVGHNPLTCPPRFRGWCGPFVTRTERSLHRPLHRGAQHPCRSAPARVFLGAGAGLVPHNSVSAAPVPASRRSWLQRRGSGHASGSVTCNRVAWHYAASVAA